ncbi:hypothetical protein ACIOYT_31725 [Streptomyces halstedii]|uniref:hypothetical protein n=1 Tax=Streptomyces halstedii TaxID=1944 RepID=UPI0038077EDE
MDTDETTKHTTTDGRSRARLARAGSALSIGLLRGAATGAGTTLGSWITWWLIHH